MTTHSQTFNQSHSSESNSHASMLGLQIAFGISIFITAVTTLTTIVMLTAAPNSGAKKAIKIENNNGTDAASVNKNIQKELDDLESSWDNKTKTLEKDFNLLSDKLDQETTAYNKEKQDQIQKEQDHQANISSIKNTTKTAIASQSSTDTDKISGMLDSYQGEIDRVKREPKRLADAIQILRTEKKQLIKKLSQQSHP